MAGEHCSDWPFVTLGEIASLSHDKIKISELNLVSYISTENMRPDRMGVYIAASLPAGTQVTRFNTGDVLFSNIRTYFRKVWFATFEGGSSPDVLVFKAKNTKILDNQFLFYLTSNQKFTDYTHKTSKGAKMPRGDKDAIFRYEFNLPPLPTQRAIAHVLGTLDDLIELNRETNELLEEMARALFKSWFVDFDPVRAKLEGRAPAGMDAETAKLFPDHFQDSELGQIPKGWEVRSLGDIVELAYGKPLKAENRKNGDVCVYGSNGIVGQHDEKLVTGPGIVVGRKGNPGSVTWAHGDFYPIDTTFYVVRNSECQSLHFLYYALAFQDLPNLSADSAVPGLNRNHAYMSKQVIPQVAVLEAFNAQIAPIFETIHAQSEESRDLAALRDTLLPKLLSGEVSVPAAEELIAASR